MEKIEDVLAGESEGVEAANERLYRQGFTDGLPVIPPTGGRIEAMLAGREPGLVVASLPPAHRHATLRGLAVCAVLAGCRPEYFPLLVAATAGLARPEFNLLGILTTTGSAAPMMIVNGPIAQGLGLNSGHGALGPGVHSNATIGRALSLVCRNLAGAIPGKLDMATIGQPGKYTFCIAENEKASPWEPLHVSRGYRDSQNTVTLVGAAGTMEVKDDASTTAANLLTTFAHSINSAGSLGGNFLLGGGEPLLLLAPEHAAVIGREMSRRQAQQYLFEKARLPRAALSGQVDAGLQKAHAARGRRAAALENELRVAEHPEDIMLAVVGGVGVKSAFVPTWSGTTRAVTQPV
ncbi:MAG: hypothetical protein V3S29_13785 [bacterium]